MGEVKVYAVSSVGEIEAITENIYHDRRWLNARPRQRSSRRRFDFGGRREAVRGRRS